MDADLAINAGKIVTNGVMVDWSPRSPFINEQKLIIFHLILMYKEVNTWRTIAA